ncbi:hypothetical protein GGI12_002683 [Dipsacomyces acuminosporus]|nr:hypothetical protein GGI12_002683 [Dipsacomyces acuminosporus]
MLIKSSFLFLAATAMVAVSASPVRLAYCRPGECGRPGGPSKDTRTDFNKYKSPPIIGSAKHRRGFLLSHDLNPGPFPDYSRYSSLPIVAPTRKDSTKQSPVKKNTSPKKQHLSIKSRSLTDRKKSKPTKKTTGPSPGQQNPGSKYQSPPFFPEQKPSNLEKFPTILPSRPGRIGIPEQRYPDLEKFPTITRPRIGVPAQKYPNLEKFPTVVDQPVVKPQFVRRSRKHTSSSGVGTSKRPTNGRTPSWGGNRGNIISIGDCSKAC